MHYDTRICKHFALRLAGKLYFKEIVNLAVVIK